MSAAEVANGKLVRERTQRTWLQKNLGRLLTMPSFIIPYALIGVWLLGVYYSLTDYDLRYGITKYIGLGNFVELFTKDKDFFRSLTVTIRYAIGCVGIQLPLGFGIALLLDRVSGIPQKIARAIVIVPMCIAPVIATLIWKIMLGPTQGIVNYLLEKVGLKAVDWLSNRDIALYTLIGIDTWIWTPFVIIVFWGGLGSLPKAPYEAATLDGASPWFIFRRLTLPLMRPFMMIALLFRACDSLNSFDIIYGSTRGGPELTTATLNLLAYDNAMNWWHLGYALAMVMVTYFLTYFVAKRLMAFWPR